MPLLVSKKNPDGKNIDITHEELEFIRSLEDFDLTMFLSDLHDFGWPQARTLLPLIAEAITHMETKQ